MLMSILHKIPEMLDSCHENLDCAQTCDSRPDGKLSAKLSLEIILVFSSSFPVIHKVDNVGIFVQLLM